MYKRLLSGIEPRSMYWPGFNLVAIPTELSQLQISTRLTNFVLIYIYIYIYMCVCGCARVTNYKNSDDEKCDILI
jgi:hypothetical protein